MSSGSDNLAILVSELCNQLYEAGFLEEAKHLKEVQSTAYTTGSEYLAEIQLAVRKALKAKHLPSELRKKLKVILKPSLSERATLHQIWRSILVGSILGLFGAAAAALGAKDTLGQYPVLWLFLFLSLFVLLGVAAYKASICPGCSLRIGQMNPKWCPFCGIGLTTGYPGPKRFPGSKEHAATLKCPHCNEAPGGRSRYGTPLVSEGPYCTNCGMQLLT